MDRVSDVFNELYKNHIKKDFAETIRFVNDYFDDYENKSKLIIDLHPDFKDISEHREDDSTV